MAAKRRARLAEVVATCIVRPPSMREKTRHSARSQTMTCKPGFWRGGPTSSSEEYNKVPSAPHIWLTNWPWSLRTSSSLSYSMPWRTTE